MIQIKEKSTEKWVFPCYGISKDRKQIVYFTKENCGVCLYAENENMGTIGEKCTTWLMKKCFEPIPKGRIIEIET